MGSRAARVFACAAAAVGVIGACSTFSSTQSSQSTDTDGGAIVDSAALDAPRHEDAKADAADADAGFCGGATWVCDTFDDPGASWPSPNWVPSTTSASDSIEIASPTTPAPISPPSVASFGLPSSNAVATAFLTNTRSSPAEAFHCVFSVALLQATPVATRLFEIFLGDSVTADFSFYVDTELHLDTEGSVTPLGPLVTNAWTTIDLDVDLGVSITLLLNGVSQKVVSNPPVPAPTTSLYVQLGAEREGAGALTNVLFDDVRCDAK